MQESAQAVLAYFQNNPVLSFGIAFVAGFTGSKTVAYAWGVFLFLIIGLLGLFLSQFVLVYFGLKEHHRNSLSSVSCSISSPPASIRLLARRLLISSNPCEPP